MSLITSKNNDRSSNLPQPVGPGLAGKTALAFFGAFLLLLPESLAGVSVFDEGFVIAGAEAVLHGQVPYRDFYSLYGPASYYLIGALFKLFGEDLLVSRVAHTLTLAGIAAISFVLANGVGGNSRRWLPWIVALVSCAVMIGSKSSPSYPAVPSALLLMIAAVVFGKWGRERNPRALVNCSLLIGVAGLFRWDFGIFGLLAAGCSLLFVDAATSRTSWQRAGASLIAVTAPAALLMALVYVPLILISDPARLFRETIVYLLFEFAKYRGLEFFRPPLIWEAHAGNTIETCSALFRIAAQTLPPVIAVAAMVAAWRELRRKDSGRPPAASSVLAAFLAFLCLALFHQMWVRPTLVQGLPAALAAVPLLGCFVSLEILAKLRYKPMRGGVCIAVFLLGVVFTSVGLDGIVRSISSRYAPPSLSRATGIRDLKSNAYYAELIRYIGGNSARGESIYSGALDHSRLWVNDSLLYFLADRPAATRFLQMDPGMANTLASQQAIVDGLKQKKVKLVVLLDRTSSEPNLSATSNGIHMLDEFIRDRYRETHSFGPYTVLELARYSRLRESDGEYGRE